MSKQATTVTDESQDQKYFTITPRLVWAFSRNPFDYTIWSVIKGIAGDSGECFLTTDDLAILSMCSTGQVSDSRKYWQSVGLLFGDFRRDPGYPQPVWHMRIPNIWKNNIEWAEKYTGLKDRVEFKRTQISNFKALRDQKRAELLSQKRLHQVEPSPGEEGVTPGEEGVTPGDTKNIHKEIKKKNVDAKASEPAEPKPQTPPPPEWGLAWQLAADVEDVVLPDEDQIAQAKIGNAVELFPQAYKELARAFILATGIFPIKADVGAWCKAFRDQDVRTGLTTEDIAQACKQMFNDKLTIKDPFSVMGVAGNIHNDLKRKVVAAENKQPNVVDTPFAQALEDKTPRSPEFQKSLEDFGKVLRERTAAKKRQTA